MAKKSRDILKAIAAGQSWEQILMDDSTLTYHDIFHSLAEGPTSRRREISAGNTSRGYPEDSAHVRQLMKRRVE